AAQQLIRLANSQWDLIPRVEYLQMIKAKDEEFVSQLRSHLTKGLIDVRRSEAAEIQAATSEQRGLISFDLNQVISTFMRNFRSPEIKYLG
ncbi:MAG: hypothetical protein ACKPKO_05890, partial [Candidatus Fonsibacter sp.]